jgi:hypothetical protein
VDAAEIVFTALLALLLLGLGGFYSWRQVRSLRRLRTDTSLSPDERRFLRAQARRRLTCSALMIIFAGLLVGSLGFEGGLAALNESADAARAAGKKPTADPEQRALVYLFSSYWMLGFLLFLAIICLAFIDIFATRRFTLRQLKQMQESHQAMLREQAARLRASRGGPA